MDRLWLKGGRRINSHESSFLHALKRRGSQTSRDLLVATEPMAQSIGLRVN